jgi:hypothetical protein
VTLPVEYRQVEWTGKAVVVEAWRLQLRCADPVAEYVVE